ncbi:MAG: acyloxyacyl hydrolase [Acidobacteriota bacterium]
MPLPRLSPVLGVLLALLAAAPATAQDNLWLVSAGGGATNRWFSLDVDDPIDAMELRAGWGRPLSARLAWLVTLDHGSYALPGRPCASSWGLAPQLRYTRGRLLLDGGIGLMYNDIESKGYTYRYKWTPQAGVGVHLFRTAAMELTLSYSLVHYSHSLLTDRRNMGINLNVFRLGVLWRR